MLEVADGLECMMGMFNTLGDMFFSRSRYCEDGKSRKLYVLRIEKGLAAAFGRFFQLSCR